jgi:hypothetical protein
MRMDRMSFEDNEVQGDARDSFAGCGASLGTMGLRLASVVGLLAWSYRILFVFKIFGGPKTFGDVLFLSFPFFYFLFSLYTSVRLIRGKALLSTGILLNLPVAVAMIWSIKQAGEFDVAAGVCLAYIILWTVFCLDRLLTKTKD